MCNCYRSSAPNIHTLALAKYWQPLISLHISFLVLIYLFWFWVHSVCRFFLCAFTSLYIVLILRNGKHIPVGDVLIMNRGTKVYRFSWHYSEMVFGFSCPIVYWVFPLFQRNVKMEAACSSDMFEQNPFCCMVWKPRTVSG